MTRSEQKRTMPASLQVERCELPCRSGVLFVIRKLLSVNFCHELLDQTPLVNIPVTASHVLAQVTHLPTPL